VLKVGGDGADKKKERYVKLACFIQALLNQDKEIPLTLTAARFAVKEGLSRSRVVEYLEDLQATGEQGFEVDRQNDKIRRVQV
jgi:hypothetical protein